MSATWTTVLALALTTALTRASGPVLLGGRRLPDRLRELVALLAPALLAALVVVQTFGDDTGGLIFDERAIGVAGAGVVLVRGGSMLWAIGIAAVLTALTRAL